MSSRKDMHARDSEERRGGTTDASIPAHEAIDAETEARLMDLAGFTRGDLYERRGPTTRRGLAFYLEDGDRIVEVCRDHAKIERRDGSRQTFWNLRRRPSWMRVLDPSCGGAGGESELAPEERG